jgi:DNA-binding XRE family transcriptional regulator
MARERRKQTDEDVDAGPIGTSAAEDRQQRAARSIEYRHLQDQYATTREIAWQLIQYRMEEGLTQQQLAKRVGTSFSHISRIESGRYMPSGTTLQKLATALNRDLRIVFSARAPATAVGDDTR